MSRLLEEILLVPQRSTSRWCPGEMMSNVRNIGRELVAGHYFGHGLFVLRKSGGRVQERYRRDIRNVLSGSVTKW